VLPLAALVLVAVEYGGDRPAVRPLFPSLAETHWGGLLAFAWWSGAKLVGYVVVPAVALRITGVPLRDCGLRVAGMQRHLGLYLLLLALVLPAIVAASYTAPFLRAYPFYRDAARSWTDLVAWELLYGASFVALEFFFRGFLLFTLRRSFGVHAVLVAVVPYCMLHFGKPAAEAIGAIAAGAILGALALHTRSIWGGVLVHVGVAWTMDLLALLHGGGLPGSGRYVGY
jgi:membrane protease YdiL (CAAX protease family)